VAVAFGFCFWRNHHLLFELSLLLAVLAERRARRLDIKRALIGESAT
jgi:hypothetical protein